MGFAHDSTYILSGLSYKLGPRNNLSVSIQGGAKLMFIKS